jgi:subtilisin family serine protease
MAPFDAAGDGGQGVRVAVVDLDFTGWESLRGVELPADTYVKSFLNSGRTTASSAHGTAVAEIIHDVAPEAQLYLLQIAETADLVQAVDWCIDNGMNVVNMSLAFIAGPRDGTGYQAEQVDRAAAAGLVWVCSAGNEGGTHWRGEWLDADADGVMEVAPGREVIGFTYPSGAGGLPSLLTQMVWDLWPSTAGLSFDLEIYRDSLRTQLVTASNGAPSLSLAHRLAVVDQPAVGRYYVSVVHRFGVIPAGLHFDVYLDNSYAHAVAPVDPFGSLVSPADARGAVAVGSYDYRVTSPGAVPARSYSSCGPTWDGRLKPEIAAGDGVSTATYGSEQFYGTSASAPHVAGAAAVLSGATVTGGLFTYVWSAEDFLRLLAVQSIDFGTAGPDSTYGWGGLVMPPASADPVPFEVTGRPNPFNGRVRLSFPMRPGSAYRLAIFDLLGRLVYRVDGLHTRGDRAQLEWCGCGREGGELPSGVYFYRVDTDFNTGLGRAVLLR